MSSMVDDVRSAETSRSEGTGTLQLVSFHLAEEEYAIEITKVREIILLSEITRVPQTPEYVRGLINLRSTVIPVIDLRRRFGLPPADQTAESRIMVVDVRGKTIGIVVDAVDEVLRVSRDKIAPPPPTVAGTGREYLRGLVKLEGRLLIFLDIDQILRQEDQEALARMA